MTELVLELAQAMAYAIGHMPWLDWAGLPGGCLLLCFCGGGAVDAVEHKLVVVAVLAAVELVIRVDALDEDWQLPHVLNLVIEADTHTWPVLLDGLYRALESFKLGAFNVVLEEIWLDLVLLNPVVQNNAVNLDIAISCGIGGTGHTRGGSKRNLALLVTYSKVNGSGGIVAIGLEVLYQYLVVVWAWLKAVNLAGSIVAGPQSSVTKAGTAVDEDITLVDLDQITIAVLLGHIGGHEHCGQIAQLLFLAGHLRALWGLYELIPAGHDFCIPLLLGKW